MSEMVERIAKAVEPICRQFGAVNIPKELAVRIARAAIAAMREPTEAMYRAAYDANGGKWADDEFEPPPKICWTAMIDAALSEEKRDE